MTRPELPRRVYVAPREELCGAVEYGFVLPPQSGRSNEPTRRIPTGRATLFFVTDARPGRGAATGLFCEGPSSQGFLVPSEFGEIAGFKLKAGAARALLGVPAK